MVCTPVLPPDEQDDHCEQREEERDEYEVHAVGVAEQALFRQVETALPTLAEQKLSWAGQ